MHGAPGLGPIDQIQSDSQERVAAQGVVAHRTRGGLIVVSVQAISEPAQLLNPEKLVEGNLGPRCQDAPGLGGLSRRAPQAIEQSEKADPQHLDLDRIPLTGRSGRMIGVHPGKVTGTPDERTVWVDADALRGSGEVA